MMIPFALCYVPIGDKMLVSEEREYTLAGVRMSSRGGGTEKEKVFLRDKTAGGSFSPPAYSGAAP